MREVRALIDESAFHRTNVRGGSSPCSLSALACFSPTDLPAPDRHPDTARDLFQKACGQGYCNLLKTSGRIWVRVSVPKGRLWGWETEAVHYIVKTQRHLDTNLFCARVVEITALLA